MRKNWLRNYREWNSIGVSSHQRPLLARRAMVLLAVEICYNVASLASGAVAQLGERSVRNAEVTGSIPVGSTFDVS